MTTRSLLTWQDAVDHTMDFMASEGDTYDLVAARRSADMALKEMSLVKDWTIYKASGRIVANAQYTTGTVTYVNSTRTVTLTGGTFPSWSNQGVLLIGSTAYQIDSNPTTTTLILSSGSNPGADISTATTYTLYQNTYPLPSNFRKLIGDVIEVGTKIIITPVKYDRTFFDLHWRVNPGQPWMYSFVGHPSFQDQIGIAFSAPPNTSRTYDFPYQRAPRRLSVCNYNTGTVSVSSATVTGSSTTAFTSNMIGSILRVSSSATAPTGIYGSNPFAEERVITGYTDAHTLTIDSAFTGSYSSVAYILSDPIDLDSSVMLNAYKRTCELQFATLRRPTDRAAIYAAWQKDMDEAMSADAKYGGERVAGERGHLNWVFRNLLYGQLGSDIANGA